MDRKGITWRKTIGKWGLLLAVFLLCGTVAVPAAGAQSDQTPSASVLVAALNVRSGPGVDYAVVGQLAQDDQLPVVGHDPASGWWQVRLADGSLGWISGGSQYVSVSGDTANVPATGVVVTAPPAAAGSTIVFQTVSGGDIYAVSPDGSGLRYLTHGIDPALSPDGQQVAFTRWDTDQNGALGSVYVISLDGSNEHVVWEGVSQPKSPTWAPGAQRLAMGVQDGGRLRPVDKCSSELPTEPLVTKQKPGKDDTIRVVVEVGPGGVDYKFCYTLLPHPYWGLGLLDLADSEYTGLPSDLFSYGPSWDPANDWRVIYEGELGLTNLDVNQDKTWPLTDDPQDRVPVFSPDGSRIAVTYWQNDHYEVHTLNADGSGRKRLTETSLQTFVEQKLDGQEPRSYNNAAPAWSPDGQSIAFVSDRSGKWEFWVMNADGSNQRPLFPAGALAGIEIQYNGVGERMLSWR